MKHTWSRALLIPRCIVLAGLLTTGLLAQAEPNSPPSSAARTAPGAGTVTAAPAGATVRDATTVLLEDPLNGTGAHIGTWRQTPRTIVDVPNGPRALRCTRGTTWKPDGLVWAGDRSWATYRVEAEVRTEKMFAEIDFHVQDDGQAGCAFTLFQDDDGTLFLELFGLWGEAGAFKMYLPGQRKPPHRIGEWINVRLDVGPAVANVFVGDDPQPAATFRDLPFADGGIRLTAYDGSALFRNLRVTALAPGSVQPILADPWAGVRSQGVLRNWQVSPSFAAGVGSDRLPESLTRSAVWWVSAPVDGRGVVNLASHFQPNNVAATAFARTTLRAERSEERHLKLTYTDNFSLWCNGARVFVGPPRQWFHPDRKKYGNSRLIPDQFDVTVPLRAGENELVVRSEAVEPFGWGFWIRDATVKPVEVTGPYFGQKPPGRTPQIFAPGILSLPDRLEARIAFSPDGTECFFTVVSDFAWSSVQLYHTKCVNNVWTPQEVASSLLSGRSGAQPFFSPDGSKLYFTSSQNGTGGIWVVERTAQGWSNPQALPSLGRAGEYSQTTDGTAYFESDRPGGVRQCDIWRAHPPQPGQTLQVENLGAPVNSNTYDGDPFISADGSYLIFSSYRSGGCGGADLYVTFANGNGGWTVPVNLNEYCPGLNTSAIEYAPSLSADGRYLFYVHLKPEAKECDVYWIENPFFDPARRPSSMTKGPDLSQQPPMR